MPVLTGACDALLEAVDSCLLLHQPALRRRIHALARRHDRPRRERALRAIQADIERSRAVCAARACMQPRLSMPPELPFSEHAQAIGGLLQAHQVLIVSGETGCGKSTQLPKLCLAQGRGIAGRIGHTQPRRIAARAIARRLAGETATLPGELAAHCVRFDDNLAPTTRVKLMTDGILLNEIHSDPCLLQYDTLIIDEVHERTLNVDLLIGYLRRVLARRPDLKLILTSATFDASQFERFFDDAVHYAIPTRSYPVELRYRPPDEGDGERDVYDAIVDAVAEVDATLRGDVLVFLPGEREIREAAARIARAGFADTEVLTLYARLDAARQARIFEPSAQRRIILATNVAETALTVPGVRHVIDSGFARVSRYSPHRKLQQLPVEKIAQANADQRSGRCGREAAGICIRLYSEADFSARRAATEPELLRTNLAGVILRLKALGIVDVERFPMVDAPATRLVKDGYSVLQELGALGPARELTTLGARLVRFPIDPRLSRVLIGAAEFGCLRECLVIAAAMSIADPRERPHEVRDAADRAHAEFADKRSDFMWFIKAWPLARALQGMPTKRQARLCRRRFLSRTRMAEWVQLHDYLHQLAVAEGLRINAQPATYKTIHTALAAGFLSHVGEWQGEHYLGCRNATFRLHPSSALAKYPPKWVVAAEIVETRERYARIAGRIEPQWLEGVAAHMLKRVHEAPHWDCSRGAVRATEIQRLYGLVINRSRRIDYAAVDAAAARALFIEQALLDDELGTGAAFLDHNRALLARIQALEARARRRDLVAPRTRLRAFYEERLPGAICSRRALMQWLRAAPEHGASLCMAESDATSADFGSVPTWLFPDQIDIAGTACKLSYRFEPGHPGDGVTLTVPLVLLPRLRVTDLDRLVPGMLSEKVETLLRALPKAQRRHVSPLREYAMAAVEAIATIPGPLPQALASALQRMTGEGFVFDSASNHSLPSHLYCKVAIVDSDGGMLAESTDLEYLYETCGAAAQAVCAALDWGVGGHSRGNWSFASVPAQISTRYGDATVIGFAALRDAGDRVELAVFDSAGAAAAAHEQGVCRLLLFASARSSKQLEKNLPRPREFALMASLFGHTHNPLPAIIAAAARRHCADYPLPRTAEEYARFEQAFAASLPARATTAALTLVELFERGARIRRRLESGAAVLPAVACEDILSQLRVLLGVGVADQLMCDDAGARFARYFDAVERRLERLEANPGKDLSKMAQLSPLWQRYLAAAVEAGASSAARGLLLLFEEFRVSLFAPELGVAAKVSARHLETALREFDGHA